MDMRKRNNTLVVLMLDVLCLPGWIFLRVPGQFLACPRAASRQA
jgi:hypothetical protein